MEQYAVKMQKRLRKGLTTGTCAAAAAQAAVQELLTGRMLQEAEVRLPNETVVRLPCVRVYSYDPDPCRRDGTETAVSQPIRRTSWYVVKDAGDDPDVTNGTGIYVTAELLETAELEDRKRKQPYLFQSDRRRELFLTGGFGVGLVTKPGLEQEIGYPAINRVPRNMIFEAAEQVMQQPEADSFPKEHQALLITVSVPDGEELAKKTFNPQLGILRGISILGSSGIVEPMSEAALVATIEIETKQVLSERRRTLLYVPGNYGEQYVKRDLGLNCRPIQCSNFIGEAIDLAVTYHAESLLLVGNFGKLVKLAGGIMNTHSRTADCRWELIGVHAALCGAAPKTIQALRDAVTTDEMLKVLEAAKEAPDLKPRVVRSILTEIDRHLRKRAGQMPIGAVLYSETYGYLGETEGAADLLAEIKKTNREA